MKKYIIAIGILWITFPLFSYGSVAISGDQATITLSPFPYAYITRATSTPTSYESDFNSNFPVYQLAACNSPSCVINLTTSAVVDPTYYIVKYSNIAGDPLAQGVYFDVFSYSTTTLSFVDITGGICPSILGTSQVCKVFPFTGSFVSTSTTATTGARISIQNVSDWNTNTRLIEVCKPVERSLGRYEVTISIPIFATGVPYYDATSTNLFDDWIGKTRCDATLLKSVQVFGFNTPFVRVIASNYSIFTVGTSSNLDIIRDNLIDRLGNPATTSISALCNPFKNSIGTAFLNLDFDVGNCAYALLVPDEESIAGAWHSEVEDRLRIAIPFSYIYRIYDVMSTTSTSTLPLLTLYLPGTSPLAGTTTLFNMNTILASTSEIQRTQFVNEGGQNFWDITMVTINYIIYGLFVAFLVNEIVKLEGKYKKNHDI